MIPTKKLGWEYSTNRWTHVVTCKEAEQCETSGYAIRAYNDNGTWRCAERGLKQPLDFGKTLTNVRIIKVRSL